MGIDNLSDNEIRQIEAGIRAKNAEVKPTFQHYGSVENMGDDEIRQMEAGIRAKNAEVKPTFQHYGSVENMSDDEIRIIEAQVSEKRQQDVPYKEYFNNLVINPNISNMQQFEDAVVRSMQSNGLMMNFATNLVNEIYKTVYSLKNIDKNDKVNVQNQKQKIENLMNIYVRYLYELKKQGWTFAGPGNFIGLEMIDSDLLDQLWQIQKQFDLTFNMPIPRDLGEYYGNAFERQGKMVPGITLMYDDLKNKEVNWHQVLNYKENELTPRQRYMQRREEAERQFNLARQEEIKKTVAYAQTQKNNNVVLDTDNIEQLNPSSVRR